MQLFSVPPYAPPLSDAELPVSEQLLSSQEDTPPPFWVARLPVTAQSLSLLSCAPPP